MQIRDDGNGIGFSRSSIPPTGMGLRNMEERLENVGGRFSFRNLKGSGLILDISLQGEKGRYLQHTDKAA